MVKKVSIETRELTKCYGSLTAVDNLNLKVFEGEFFGLLGPNGAGKTTTVKMLTGVIKPTKGMAFIMGVNIMERPIKVKRLIGVVPELSNVYVELSAWENLMFIAELYDVSRAEAVDRAKTLLEMLDLYDRRHDKVSVFSKGMRRRLTIAAALIHKPSILFLDEPTSGLDVQSTRIIRDVLRKLSKEGVTIFMTTHFIEEADQMCDKIGIINKGRLIALGKPEELKRAVGEGLAVEISFSQMPRLEEVKRLSWNVVEAGDKLKVYADSPSKAILELLNMAESKGWAILSVKTLTPSLEDVFVKLTGLTAVEVERLELLKPRRGRG